VGGGVFVLWYGTACGGDEEDSGEPVGRGSDSQD